MGKSVHNSKGTPFTAHGADLLLALHRISALLQDPTLSEGDVFKVFAEQIEKIGLSGIIVTHDDKSGHLTVRSAVHRYRYLTRLAKLVGFEVQGYSFSEKRLNSYLKAHTVGETIYLDEINSLVKQLIPRSLKRVGERILEDFKEEVGVLARLKFGGQHRGFIYIGGDGLVPADVPVVQAMADHLSLALDRSHLSSSLQESEARFQSLFESEKKRVWILESLRQASLSLTASLELEPVLSAILETTLALLPEVGTGLIFLYYPEANGTLTFAAALWRDGRRGQPVAMPRSNGLTYMVARQGELIYVPDMHSHPLYNSAPKEWSGSIIGLPLKIGDRVVGVMKVSSSQVHAFSEDDLAILRLLGDQAAIAIENAHLFEQAATERRHLSLLFDIGRELVGTLDTDEILSRAITLTCQALGGLLGEAFLYLPEEGQLSLRAMTDRDARMVEMLDEQLNRDQQGHLAKWVCQKRQPANLADVTQDPRWLHVPGVYDDVRSALIAPILHGERLSGVLSVLHHQPGAFSEVHLNLLQAICHQVGLALSNAGRYQQVQRLVDLLAAEQYRLESLMEHLPAGVILLDADHRLMVANSLGREILTLLSTGQAGQPLTSLGPHSVEVLISQPASPLPVEITLPGPPQRVFEAQARLLGGERPQWVLTIRDVTQERENLARIQMQERLATVGQLAAGIAHDFNNIMAAIMVYTDLLQRDLELVPAGRDRLTIIQHQVQRAASLIRQILDFSRRSVMEQSTLDLLPFIKELLKLLERILPETIHLGLSYEPEIYLVNADPTRLQQVFMNLAVNARDAMPQGGKLQFDLGWLRIDPENPPHLPELDPGDWVWIAVRDTGRGIPPELMPRIFEPFFTTKPTGEGTGLGLAQAYGIIKQHGGHIDVQSKVAEGTSFIIYLPALPVSSQEEHWQREVPEIQGKGETVLVVEDDWATREAMQALLEANHYRVLVASDGVEALQLYEQHGETITVVISDVVMPQMGGVTLYHALRKRWQQVKILFITGHPLEEENQALLEKGNVHWLQKPFSASDFNQALQNLIEEEK